MPEPYRSPGELLAEAAEDGAVAGFGADGVDLEFVERTPSRFEADYLLAGDICEVADAAQQPFRHPHGPARTATGAGMTKRSVRGKGRCSLPASEERFGPGPAPDMFRGGCYRLAGCRGLGATVAIAISRVVNRQDVSNRSVMARGARGDCQAGPQRVLIALADPVGQGRLSSGLQGRTRWVWSRVHSALSEELNRWNERLPGTCFLCSGSLPADCSSVHQVGVGYRASGYAADAGPVPELKLAEHEL